ncbi:MAG: bifunctional aldolase/short-chain dehydrogenase [Alphaproteobacteria bacterium]|nr:bifunctional aldolase/short-chain dehydrogenase [Alphaproteobacteria bacterium]
MKSAWVDRDADAAVARYRDVPRDLALRVYTTRLLGAEARLVLHGGGNTSLKTRLADLNGDEVDVLCVKGSGWDMATIEPPGLPAVRLAPLKKLRARAAMSDDDFARVPRANLIDPTAPAPSVELLLHAFMPAKFIDHTHASAVLSLTDQPNGEDLCAEVFGEHLGFVPYVMPGFGLARKAADVFDANPRVEGLILHKHGIFTFGADAREAYERMIEMVTRAEDHVARGAKTFAAAALPLPIAPLCDVAPIVRGACSLPDAQVEGGWTRFVMAFRAGDAVMRFVNGAELHRYAQAGVVTPDHTIRTKNWPLILPAPESGKLAAFAESAKVAVSAFAERYRGYFESNNARHGGRNVPVDPLPRVALVPGLGLFGLGRSVADAGIAADIGEAAIDTITGAEAIGRFESISEADMFDMEYWPLERAKLPSRKEPPLAGQIVAVTGAGSGIGAATARAFAAAGAAVALLDLNLDAATERARAIDPAAIAVRCDVTDPASVCAAFDQVVAAFGGLDVAVSNAGTAPQGKIGEVDEEVLRASFEINFYGHQRVAQAAVKIMLAQRTGGCLLFNVSKQAVNPGANFGPYGLPKAATFLLVRQYALEYGAEGIRANAVNADRIRSGLMTDDFIKQRAKARGLSEKDYMSGNLLHREVTADDVAQAFLHQALALKTTADVTTVDGGNIAAALR